MHYGLTVKPGGHSYHWNVGGLLLATSHPGATMVIIGSDRSSVSREPPFGALMTQFGWIERCAKARYVGNTVGLSVWSRLRELRTALEDRRRGGIPLGDGLVCCDCLGDR